MRLRSWLLSILAASIATALIAAMVRSAGFTASDFTSLLFQVRPLPLLLFGIATSLHILLAAEKWRLVQARLELRLPGRREAFAFSAIGTALGQLLPIPVASAASRALGNRLVGEASARSGAIASVWEQLFDLGVMTLLLPASVFALITGSASLFAALGIPALILGGILVTLASRCLQLVRSVPLAFVRRAADTLGESNLLDRTLSMRLYLLSLCRFVTLWAMCLALNWMLEWPAPSLAFAIGLPVVVLGSVLTMLPGGLGASEWSYVTTMTTFGTPLPQAVSWAFANRLWNTQVSLLIGAVAMVLILRRPHLPRSARVSCSH
ncbi:lysylphosphatidylglycerol synthase domain-containing protein [Sphingosinicella sp. BN140058]|uniref:lysylphosphatidylglycerol synthase domain-containing protein n=1 Tax=Sphingosinicella sp. BN140058 TaxID=1892855 RepID=UPI001011EE0A|nr:lysylphosphatidylglycerol synthase domain-containing protein [Sphingosinicella sp. BN140058]QAY76984.1 flippase-like domain-containing protein [Sphingosinicella sp. BN140058]